MIHLYFHKFDYSAILETTCISKFKISFYVGFIHQYHYSIIKPRINEVMRCKSMCTHFDTVHVTPKNFQEKHFLRYCLICATDGFFFSFNKKN